jgi:hypothetical protein
MSKKKIFEKDSNLANKDSGFNNARISVLSQCLPACFHRIEPAPFISPLPQ